MIYLLSEEREYLKTILDKQPDWWVRDSILGKIKYEEERIEDVKTCEHSFGSYEGAKECCIKCGKHAEGMGEGWTFKKLLSEEDIKKLEDSVKNIVPKIPDLFS